MITDNFYDPTQKFICGARFQKSASPLVRRGARLSMKLCQFALRHEQPMRWRLIEGILKSSAFIITVYEFFTKEPTRNYIG